MTREEAIGILKRTYRAGFDGDIISVEDGQAACRVGVDALEILDWILANCEVTEDLGIHGSRTFGDLDEIRSAMKGNVLG